MRSYSLAAPPAESSTVRVSTATTPAVSISTPSQFPRASSPVAPPGVVQLFRDGISASTRPTSIVAQPSLIKHHGVLLIDRQRAPAKVGQPVQIVVLIGLAIRGPHVVTLVQRVADVVVAVLDVIERIHDGRRLFGVPNVGDAAVEVPSFCLWSEWASLERLARSACHTTCEPWMIRPVSLPYG